MSTLPDEGSPCYVVVDHDPSLRSYTRRCVERCPQRPGAVYEAPDAATALRLARERTVHLIICAVELPGMGGLELVARLRADSRLATLPVILIAAGEPGRSERAPVEAIPRVALLGRPFSSRKLCRAVQSLLSGRSRT